MSVLFLELSEAAGKSEASPANSQVKELVKAYWLARGLRLAVELDLPEILSGHSRTVAEIALMTGADTVRLQRLMTALAAAGIFHEVRPGVYGTTPVARSLEAERNGTLRRFLLSELSEERTKSWERFEDEILTR